MLQHRGDRGAYRSTRVYKASCEARKEISVKIQHLRFDLRGVAPYIANICVKIRKSSLKTTVELLPGSH